MLFFKEASIWLHLPEEMTFWDLFYLINFLRILNRIYINDESKDIDVFVTHSDMKNHYFAGYSNALKNFMPGICKYETIERNHALALKDNSTFGHHPLHPLKDDHILHT